MHEKKIFTPPFSMGRHDGRGVEVSGLVGKTVSGTKRKKGTLIERGVKGTSESEEGRPVLPFSDTCWNIKSQICICLLVTINQLPL